MTEGESRRRDESISRETEPAADGNSLRPDFSPWLDCGTRATRDWIEASSAVLQRSVAAAEQTISFAQTGLKTDLDLWQALSGCGRIGERADSRMKYGQRTTSDCPSEPKDIAGHARGTADAATLPPRA